MTENLHGTAVVVGEAGVLIRGRSGAGKTTLALALLDRVRHDRGFAALVADDRVAVSVHGGRLIARPPHTIAGLAERHGLGIVALPHEAGAVLTLLVDLVPDATMDRMPAEEDATLTLAGVPIARITVPERAVAVSVPLILAMLASLVDAAAAPPLL